MIGRQSDPSDPCIQCDKFVFIQEGLNVFGLVSSTVPGHIFCKVKSGQFYCVENRELERMLRAKKD